MQADLQEIPDAIQRQAFCILAISTQLWRSPLCLMHIDDRDDNGRQIIALEVYSLLI